MFHWSYFGETHCHVKKNYTKIYSDYCYGCSTRTRILMLYQEIFTYVMLCVIWYHLYNLKNVEQHSWNSVTFSEVAGFTTKSNAALWVLFTLYKLYKWYQMAQRIKCKFSGWPFARRLYSRHPTHSIVYFNIAFLFWFNSQRCLWLQYWRIWNLPLEMKPNFFKETKV